MNSLTTPLRDHHTCCDELFAFAEEAVSGSHWADAQRLLLEFVAAMETHFRTEEDLLFPAFEEATGMSMGPTRMMRFEHAQMRDLFVQMSAAMTAQDSSGFSGVAETLLVLMQQHNMKEENILYPMCDRGLEQQFAVLGQALRTRLGDGCSITL